MKEIKLSIDKVETLYFFLKNINEEYLCRVLKDNFCEEQVADIYSVLDYIYGQLELDD